MTSTVEASNDTQARVKVEGLTRNPAEAKKRSRELTPAEARIKMEGLMQNPAEA